ncbi:hypothetical protein [Flavobacterium sp. N3904]|uniref:hypothetical protein n=1 Tax=Flavobacterium sp. N3904 TaxID=2986835 RepID=UPI00222436D5|nr:hypothetical protein [Flavobacterium sp. N3904]
MEKVLFIYKNKLDVLSLFFYAFIAFLLISFINNDFDFEILFGAEIFALVMVYLTRYNAVNIDFHEKYMLIKFYILKKEIIINYNQIIEIRDCYDRYIGSNIRFKIKHVDKLIVFRIKTSDNELKKFLRCKVSSSPKTP